MERRVSRLALVSLAALLVAACAPAAPSPTAAPAKPAPTAAPAKPAEAKPATTPAKAVDLSGAKTVDEVLAAVRGLPAPDREKALVEKASKEGELLYYTSIQADQATKYLEQFKKKYPTLKANLLRKSGGALFETTMNEARAGKQLWDVQSANAEFIHAYQQQGLLTAYDGPTLAEIPKEYKDPQGQWAALYLNGVPIAWNTTKVKPAEAPKSYQDLLDPKWNGKFAMDTEDFEWFQFILESMGEQQGLDFHKKLKANNPIMIRGRTGIVERLIAGDFPIGGVLHDQAVANAKKDGAPVDFDYPRPALIKLEPLVIAKKANNPAAAVLFMDWAFSQPSQHYLTTEFLRATPHPAVKHPFPDVAKAREGKILTLDLTKFSRDFEKIQTQFKEIYLK